MDDIIKKEIEIWEKRVFYPDEKFKENTKADLNLLISRLKKSREFFTIISSETEACIYKIGRFMVESGFKNEFITFLDGDELENYIDVNTKYDYQAKQLIDDFFTNYGNTFKNKWLIIPYLSSSWNKKLVYYFIDKLKQNYCYGILFYSNKNKPDGLAQIMCEETYIDVFQFPQSIYKHKKEIHELEKDDY